MSAEVLGFAGKQRSGKTTAAEALRRVAGVPSAHIEFSNSVLSVANRWMARVDLDATEVTPAMLDELCETVGEDYGIKLDNAHMQRLSLDGLQDYLAARAQLGTHQREVSLHHKETHRPLLVWLGREMVEKVDPDFWSRAVRTQINSSRRNGLELITVGGIRFSGDADMIHAERGSVIGVVRSAASTKGVSVSSEGTLRRGQVDATILNDGTVDELTAKAGLLWCDMQRERLKPEY